jgi:hypothetical protein
VLDTVAQSMAHALVGTARSTVTLVALRRVHSWQGGISRQVQWGWPDADKQSTLNATRDISITDRD